MKDKGLGKNNLNIWCNDSCNSLWKKSEAVKVQGHDFKSLGTGKAGLLKIMNQS